MEPHKDKVNGNQQPPTTEGGAAPEQSQPKDNQGFAPRSSTASGDGAREKGTKFNTPAVAGIVIVIILIVGALVYFVKDNGSNGTQGEENALLQGGDPGEVVANVNGASIIRAELNDQITQLSTLAGQQGMDLASEDTRAILKEQALETLINIQLLVQEAKEEGILVDPTRVDAQYDQVVQSFGGEESFATQLETLDLTTDEVWNNIKDQLAIEEYLRDYIGAIEVTPEESRSLYEQLAEGQEDVPTYEEVAAQVTAQLRAQKEQEVVEELLTSLKEGADIEIIE